MSPLVSIITVVRNAKSELSSTIASVHALEEAADFEHVIVDGDSSDGTNELAKSMLRFNDQLISERDKGIYDAMNKGVQLARGEWVIFMNAGDVFATPDTLSKLRIDYLHEADVVLGSTIVTLADKLQARKFYRTPATRSEWWKGMPTVHQSVLYRRSLLIATPFDLQYGWCADFDQFVRLVSNEARVVESREIISIYDGNGADGRSPWIYFWERFKISRKNAPAASRWLYFGKEAINLAIMGPAIRVVRSLTPMPVLLKLREWRGTVGLR